MSLDGSLPPGVEQRDIDRALDGVACDCCGSVALDYAMIYDEESMSENVLCKRCRKEARE